VANPLLALRGALFSTGASEVVTYTPAGPNPAGVSLRAVRSGDAAITLGAAGGLGGNPLRGTSFEIQQTDLAEKPKAGATITDAEGIIWLVKQATDQNAVGSWLIVVERGVA
jgi:hypothetical protein